MTEKRQVGRPKGSKKEDTLKKIMPEARRLFSEKGYAQTTFKDVGKALGISHAALYTYFSSKKDLYLATLADTQTYLLPYYIEAFEMDGPLKAKISYILMAMAKEHDADASITGLLAAVPIEMRRHGELYEALYDSKNAIMDALIGIVEDAKREGELKRNITAEQLVAALFGGGVGVALFQYGMRGPDLSSRMDVFVSMLNAELFV